MNIQLTKPEQQAMQAAQLFEDSNAMYEYAPSLFATQAHPKMSDKYAFTNTYDILLHIHNRGFRVVSVSGGDRLYKKVLVRMRSTHHDARDNAPEIIIIDSHDGSSRLKMCLGIIRFVCMNGMIAGDLLYSRSFLHRSADLMAQVILELEEVNSHITALTARVDRMRNHKTTLADRLVLTNSVIRERWGEEKDSNFILEMRTRLLQTRRYEDEHQDMYTVMNVIQENVLRGGMSYIAANNRMTTVRPISDVRRNVNINQTLWNCAEQLLTKEAA
jgi:Domain of unknown function (DUF932)